MTISTLVSSCVFETKKSANQVGNFEMLPIPTDSNALYFITSVNAEDSTKNALDSFLNEWFSKMLFALQEPIISNYNGSKELYRFTWLRTFHHPISIRLEKQGSMIQLFSKVSDGSGGYDPGNMMFDTAITQTKKQIDTVNSKLKNATFWNLPTLTDNDRGKDGAMWIIEVYKEGQYKVVVQSSPNKGDSFRAIGEYLFSISQIKIDPNERPYWDY